MPPAAALLTPKRSACARMPVSIPVSPLAPMPAVRSWRAAPRELAAFPTAARASGPASPPSSTTAPAAHGIHDSRLDRDQFDEAISQRVALRPHGDPGVHDSAS